MIYTKLDLTGDRLFVRIFKQEGPRSPARAFLMNKYNSNRQAFLQTFFGNRSHEVIELNGFILEKHQNGITGGSEVAIYTKKAWNKRINFLKKKPTPSESVTIKQV